jgi:leucyl-tRNA synthetase
MEYKFNEIEKKWQDYWREKKTYSVPNESAKPKYYVLDMFPYPSGAGLHVGHPLGYIASDIYSRYKRLKGFNVLHPMGFDSFGLPAEQYALETGQHPAETTKKNIATFKSQLDKIGFCYDWEREVQTSDPNYYKWTQWIFLQLFNSYYDKKENKAKPIAELIKYFEANGTANCQLPTANAFTAAEWQQFDEVTKQSMLMDCRLAFSKYGEVNWCEALGTVLANDEVVNGVSERGGHPVEKKKMRQWYLRITDYADRLLEGLETVEFSDSMKDMQRNWIGKSLGAEINFDLISSPSPLLEKGDGKTLAKNEVRNEAVGNNLENQGNKENIEGSEFSHPSPRSGEGQGVRVYTTRPDTIFGVDFMVLAPELDLVQQIKTPEQTAAVDEYIAYVKSRSDVDRMAEKKITGCFTGAYAINPFDGRQIPIWISEYVLAGYGTGAIMAVPCGDERDFKFAKYFNIPITNIIGAHFNGEEANATKEAVLENSGFLNGMTMMDAAEVVLQKLEEQNIGKRKVNYRMRDAGFSRQRYWGEPFPIIWSDGIALPLDADELPLELPHVDKYGPGKDGEGPLSNLTNWVNLTPNPSPKERGAKDPGYMNSTKEEWRRTLQFAKQNRKDATVEEDIIWQELRNRKIADFKFRRQHPIAGYIPDFVCLEKKLIVEIDGTYHTEAEQIKFDAARESWLAEQGFTMIRFTNYEVNNSLNTVLKNIEQALSNKESISEAAVSSPSPLERGRGEVKRETSTMPGYAGSSWYFLRYMDPENKNTFCDRKVSDYWNQVDLYIGGTEHAVGHLLYSRLWTKVLYDLGHIGFDEPFRKLLNQGMIQGSSRFVNVYELSKSYEIVGGSQDEWKEKSIPPFFISETLIYENENPETLEKVRTLINKKLQVIFGKKVVEKPKMAIPFKPLRVPVEIVDGLELNQQLFRKWRCEYENAIFICDEQTLSTKEKSVGKYMCGSEVEKMSKSKFNTVNPNELCDKYGADTFRMYEMFLGPVEASKPWDTKGIEGVHRFLRKLWRLFFDDIKGKVWTNDPPTDAEIKILHRTIKKIEEDTEKFSFNTAVSAFMICINDLADAKCHKKDILEKVLILLVPYAPHIAEELWHQLGNTTTILDAEYPTFNPALLVESSKEYPVSINGKVRTNINLSLNLEQADVEKIITENEVVQKWLEGKAPKKIIYVKNKMINVVT